MHRGDAMITLFASTDDEQMRLPDAPGSTELRFLTMYLGEIKSAVKYGAVYAFLPVLPILGLQRYSPMSRQFWIAIPLAIAFVIAWAVLVGRYLDRRFGRVTITLAQRAKMAKPSLLMPAVSMTLLLAGFVSLLHFRNTAVLNVGILTLQWVKNAFDRNNLPVRRWVYAVPLAVWTGCSMRLYVLHWGGSARAHLKSGAVNLLAAYGVLSILLALFDYNLLCRLTRRGAAA